MILDVKDLTVQIEANVLIEHVSFSIGEGDILAIIGPNGSGKTTLIKALIGLLPITSGEVSFNPRKGSTQKTTMSYVPQHYHFDRTFPITVQEFLCLSTQNDRTPEKQIEDRLVHVGMEGKKEKLLGNLSGGELQRALIARSLMHEPDIIFFDEPEANIDASGSKKFYEIIQHLNREHGTTIIIVSHEVDFIYRYATTVLGLNRSVIFFGKPAEMMGNGALKSMYGEEFLIRKGKEEKNI